MDVQQLPFLAEYSKSNRASCRLCKEKIEKDVLRLAAMVQSPRHDGKIPQWYHEDCFFKKQRPKSEGDVANFGALRYEDQKKIRNAIALSAEGIVATACELKGKGKKRTAGETLFLKDYGVEYAPSGRSMCRGCEIKILKDEVRIKKVSYDTEVGMKYGGQSLWYHAECFAKLRSELGYFEKAEVIPGFGSIKPDDQANLKQLLPAVNAEDVPTKKIKEEVKDEVEKAKDDEEEKQLAAQQEAFYKIRDTLKNLRVTKLELTKILQHNKQDVPESTNEVLDRVCDIMLFGALERCQKCGGQYVLQKSSYVCIGNLTDWVKCLNEEKAPPRRATTIPAALKKAYSFLNDYKPVVRDRTIRYVPPSTSAAMKNVMKEENVPTEPKVKREKPPLHNLEFLIWGKTPTPQNQLKQKIQKLGGKVVKYLASHTAAIISTPREVEKMGYRMLEAKQLQIQVVPEDFIECAQAGNALSYIVSQSICDWGSDPQTRIPAGEESKPRSKKSIYEKHVPSTMKIQMKNGLVVDPDSGLIGVTHVYTDDEVIYNCVLNKVDIQMDNNSFYKMQVLEGDLVKKYYLFRSWGRIGTTIGSVKTDTYYTAFDAIEAFKKQFKEKTGNEWDRHDSEYQKVRDMFFPIEIDYSEKRMKRLPADSDIKSELSLPVQDLVRMLFDVDAMNRVMVEFELDMEKMPLGKLSQRQLQSAMKILSEISDLIGSGGTNAQFIDASNRFYSFIPHNFGVSAPKVLDTLGQVKEKQTMIESLLEIEFAYSLLNSEEGKSDRNPLDVHYEQLKTEIEPVLPSSEEFALLQKYVRNTHAATHNGYELEIEEIFRIKRKGEEDRYLPFRTLHNRKLLWHGSRLTNFVGILTNGLKIAPPEAPATGYMFGKGIYFADMVSKSANYCCTHPADPKGLMLLCEVALGDVQEFSNAQYVQNLPIGKHSVKGVGHTQPNPKASHIRPDGVEIPLGKGVPVKGVNSPLLYNEYIVYDVAQVNCQYLLKMNFKYKCNYLW
ncbi:poly [ADP-ribose] polymerase-like [Anopheles ziemanni]|uniref:poly [ADP-ribose] polymerase-like n=1 Tax=Anopheles coustani TaxID=139045 RepID=UPI00265878A4|nr:poly [ADP-ribose] polymerase-like [Anopheles coustani]XP_058173023.1 poly [ADP-ribose] polymerase-like [Anopheles ziemanni]